MEKHKKSYKNNKSAPTWNGKFELPDLNYIYQTFEMSSTISSKIMKQWLVILQ